MVLFKVRLIYESETGIADPTTIEPVVLDDEILEQIIEDHLFKTKLKGDTSQAPSFVRKHDLYVVHDPKLFSKFKLSLKLGSCNDFCKSQRKFWKIDKTRPKITRFTNTKILKFKYFCHKEEYDKAFIIVGLSDRARK